MHVMFPMYGYTLQGRAWQGFEALQRVMKVDMLEVQRVLKRFVYVDSMSTVLLNGTVLPRPG